MGSGDAHYLLRGLDGSGGALLRVELRYSGGYELRINTVRDNNDWASTGWDAITDEPHTLEIDWQASSAAGPTTG